MNEHRTDTPTPANGCEIHGASPSDTEVTQTPPPERRTCWESTDLTHGLIIGAECVGRIVGLLDGLFVYRADFDENMDEYLGSRSSLPEAADLLLSTLVSRGFLSQGEADAAGHPAISLRRLLMAEAVDAMTEDELDADLRARGIDPDAAVEDLRQMAARITEDARLAEVTLCRSCGGPSHGRNICVYCETDQPRPSAPCLVCGDTSQGGPVCGWCQREPVGAALVRMIGAAPVDPAAWSDLVGAIRGTVDDESSDLVSELGEAQDKIAELNARIAELQAKLLKTEARYLDCYEDLLRVTRERGEAREQLAAEVGRSPEARVVALREAGAGLISLHVDDAGTWSVDVDRIEDRHADYASIEGTLDEACADAIAWLRATTTNSPTREG